MAITKTTYPRNPYVETDKHDEPQRIHYHEGFHCYKKKDKCRFIQFLNPVKNMKYAFRAVLFHFVCLIYFAILYMSCKDEFISREPLDVLDCVGLSAAIQSGVGEKENTMAPSTHFSKSVIMIQEFCMLSTNVFLLYFLVNV